MSQAQDRTAADTEIAPPETTRRLLLRGLTGGAVGAALAGSMQAGVAGQDATPQPAVTPPPRLEWIGTLAAQLAQPIVIGETPHGTRLVGPVASGTLEGPELSGTLLQPGADWILVRPDGVGELDVRITIAMQDGALVYVTYGGYFTNVLELLPRWAQGEEISPDEYSITTTPRFETSAAQYDWLQRTVVVGIGSLTLGGVSYELFAVYG